MDSDLGVHRYAHIQSARNAFSPYARNAESDKLIVITSTNPFALRCMALISKTIPKVLHEVLHFTALQHKYQFSLHLLPSRMSIACANQYYQ